MSFVTFDLERWQSQWEHRVRANLSESGVHPLTVAQLLELGNGDLDTVAKLQLGYSQSDGSDELRGAIAALYAGATIDDVTVTVGSSEANFIACWTLLEPGDNVAVLTPTYKQTPGLARNFGATVTDFGLRYELGWEVHADEVERAIAPGTRLVVVTNPNNPTGHVLADESRQAILDRAQAVGAWILADEVYQGAERNGETTPSLWGSYERLLVVNGLSKAYGLPGLRIGWIVGPREFKAEVVRRHDYTVICPPPVSDYLATLALRARDRIFERTRGILNANYPTIEGWLRGFDSLFEWHPPDCGAICFVRYHHSMSALDLVERVRTQQGILLVPGDHFDRPHHIRFGYGNERSQLEQALEELTPVFAQMVD